MPGVARCFNLRLPGQGLLQVNFYKLAGCDPELPQQFFVDRQIKLARPFIHRDLLNSIANPANRS